MESIDYTAAKFWITLIELVGIVVIAIYVWWSNRNKVQKERVDQLQSQLIEQVQQLSNLIKRQDNDEQMRNKSLLLIRDLENRMQAVEITQKGMPTHRDFKDIYNKLDATKSLLDQLIGETNAIHRQFGLVFESALQGK